MIPVKFKRKKNLDSFKKPSRLNQQSTPFHEWLGGKTRELPPSFPQPSINRYLNWLHIHSQHSIGEAVAKIDLGMNQTRLD